jgi:midasin (ATPase involved in ribosome maturation)
MYAVLAPRATAASASLCEQLRLILAPTRATQLRGDFRSGKRLNMRRLVPYVASEYRKDRIWLRRTKPAKRQHQILIAVDDSQSMVGCGAAAAALEAVVVLLSALATLESGDIGVMRFGDEVEDLIPLKDAATAGAAHALPAMLGAFGFEQRNTGFKELLQAANAVFDKASADLPSDAEAKQLLLIVTDGIVHKHDAVGALCRQAMAHGRLPVLVILDPENKISTIQSISFAGAGEGRRIVKRKYLDMLQFPYYVHVRDLDKLPAVLATALRQFFERSTNEA